MRNPGKNAKFRSKNRVEPADKIAEDANSMISPTVLAAAAGDRNVTDLINTAYRDIVARSMTAEGQQIMPLPPADNLVIFEHPTIKTKRMLTPGGHLVQKLASRHHEFIDVPLSMTLVAQHLQTTMQPLNHVTSNTTHGNSTTIGGEEMLSDAFLNIASKVLLYNNVETIFQQESVMRSLESFRGYSPDTADAAAQAEFADWIATLRRAVSDSLDWLRTRSMAVDASLATWTSRFIQVSDAYTGELSESGQRMFPDLATIFEDISLANRMHDYLASEATDTFGTLMRSLTGRITTIARWMTAFGASQFKVPMRYTAISQLFLTHVNHCNPVSIAHAPRALHSGTLSTSPYLEELTKDELLWGLRTLVHNWLGNVVTVNSHAGWRALNSRGIVNAPLDAAVTITPERQEVLETLICDLFMEHLVYNISKGYVGQSAAELSAAYTRVSTRHRDTVQIQGLLPTVKAAGIILDTLADVYALLDATYRSGEVFEQYPDAFKIRTEMFDKMLDSFLSQGDLGFSTNPQGFNSLRRLGILMSGKAPSPFTAELVHMDLPRLQAVTAAKHVRRRSRRFTDDVDQSSGALVPSVDFIDVIGWFFANEPHPTLGTDNQPDILAFQDTDYQQFWHNPCDSRLFWKFVDSTPKPYLLDEVHKLLLPDDLQDPAMNTLLLWDSSPIRVRYPSDVASVLRLDPRVDPGIMDQVYMISLGSVASVEEFLLPIVPSHLMYVEVPNWLYAEVVSFKHPDHVEEVPYTFPLFYGASVRSERFATTSIIELTNTMLRYSVESKKSNFYASTGWDLNSAKPIDTTNFSDNRGPAPLNTAPQGTDTPQGIDVEDNPQG